MDRRNRLSRSHEEAISVPIDIEEAGKDLPCQEDGSGSVKSSNSEMVACGFGSACTLQRQHSKSCSNLEEVKNGKKRKEHKKHQEDSVASHLNGASQITAGLTDDVFASGPEASPFTSYFSSIHQNHESYMYSTGPLVKEIAKRKLVEPGNILEKVLKLTIPNIATASVSIISCVSDCFTRNVFTMGYLTVTLTGEAKQNYRLKLNSYKVNLRSSVKEKTGMALTREPEETFTFWELSGHQTFQFKVGAPKSLMKLTGEVVALECEIGIVPTSKYRLSVTSDFLNISLKDGGIK